MKIFCCGCLDECEPDWIASLESGKKGAAAPQTEDNRTPTWECYWRSISYSGGKRNVRLEKGMSHHRSSVHPWVDVLFHSQTRLSLFAAVTCVKPAQIIRVALSSELPHA